MKKIFIFLISLIIGYMGFSQNYILFSRCINTMSLVNPAVNGTRNAVTAVLIYRNQWTGLLGKDKGTPIAEAFNINGPIPFKNLGLGLSALNEEIGMHRYFNVYGIISYKVRFKRDKFLSFGLQGGVKSYVWDFTKAKVNDEIDPTLFSDDSYLKPNVGFGSYLYDERYFIALAFPELLYDNTKQLNIVDAAKNLHFFINCSYLFQLTRKTRFKPTILMRNVYGAPMELDISAHFLFKNIEKRDVLWIGMAYRTGDALFPMIEIKLNKFLWVGYTFEFPLTAMVNHTIGSHEFRITTDFKLKKRIVPVCSPRYF